MKKILFIFFNIILAIGTICGTYYLVRIRIQPYQNLILQEGSEAYKDKFAVLLNYAANEAIYKETGYILGKTIDEDLIYKKILIDVPLSRGDYYWGKHINASSAVNELNQIRVLKPGDRVRVIRDGYLTMGSGRGYVRPGAGFMYASGVCWSTSTLGMLMDEANKVFNEKYKMPLFVFNKGDRTPHPSSYRTYQFSNNGRGYTVVKIPNGGAVDYSFTLNPALKDVERFANIKINIVMNSSIDNQNGYLGQSLGGYLQTNIDF